MTDKGTMLAELGPKRIYIIQTTAAFKAIITFWPFHHCSV